MFLFSGFNISTLMSLSCSTRSSLEHGQVSCLYLVGHIQIIYIYIYMAYNYYNDSIIFTFLDGRYPGRYILSSSIELIHPYVVKRSFLQSIDWYVQMSYFEMLGMFRLTHLSCSAGIIHHHHRPLGFLKWLIQFTTTARVTEIGRLGVADRGKAGQAKQVARELVLERQWRRQTEL